jgi:DNA replication and repair protein RecF
VALASISIRGFRNLEPTIVGFAEGSNYLFGPNGAGKTNLLEAIHYLATGRSFRRCPDADLLGFGRDVLIVSGTDESGETAEIRFDGREKRILRNNIPVEKLSEYFGWLPVVVLLLEDIELVRGAPSIRRGYLDMALAKADRRTSTDYADYTDHRADKSEAKSQKPKAKSEEQSYITLMGEYRRAVGQYNRLLERGARDEGRGTGDEVAAWEEELVRAGVPVCEARLAKVGGLLENAARHYERLAGHGAVFSYRSSVVPDATRGTGHDPKSQGGFGSCPQDLAEAFRQRLAATRERARALRHALVGPHRDDIRIVRGERELRKFGSVGEQRLAGIALRLAEADMILSAGRQRPVFLLDEVASELDEQRSRLVLAMVAERGQMVYAAARRTVRLEVRSQKSEGRRQDAGADGTAVVRDAASLEHLSTGALEHFSGKEFHVEAGKVSEVS